MTSPAAPSASRAASRPRPSRSRASSSRTRCGSTHSASPAAGSTSGPKSASPSAHRAAAASASSGGQQRGALVGEPQRPQGVDPGRGRRPGCSRRSRAAARPGRRVPGAAGRPWPARCCAGCRPRPATGPRRAARRGPDGRRRARAAPAARGQAARDGGGHAVAPHLDLPEHRDGEHRASVGPSARRQPVVRPVELTAWTSPAEQLVRRLTAGDATALDARRDQRRPGGAHAAALVTPAGSRCWPGRPRPPAVHPRPPARGRRRRRTCAATPTGPSCSPATTWPTTPTPSLVAPSPRSPSDH